MATKPLLDFEALWAEIPGNNPADAALRYAGDYDEIKALLPKPDRDAFEDNGQDGQWPKLVPCRGVIDSSKRTAWANPAGVWRLNPDLLQTLRL